MEDKKPTGFITFGPKNNYQTCVQIFYTPTPEQIKNLQDLFGFDFVTMEEDKVIWREK